MTATLDTAANILKEYYDSTDIVSFLVEDSPTLGILPKRTDFGGGIMPLPFMYAPTAGVATVMSSAQAAKADASEEKWDLTTHDIFSLFSLDHKARQAASRGGAKAFVDLVESRADAAMQAAKMLINRYIFGNGGGAIGTIESSTATTVTLTSRSALHCLYRNFQIQPATTDGTSGALINDIITITNVNRQTRTLTASSVNTTNYAANNSIFIRGSFGNALRGFAAWFPTSAPSSTAFFGVDRTLDSRMYGTIRTTTMLGDDSSLEEACISLTADCADAGGNPNYIIMNSRLLRVLVKQLGAKVCYERVPAQRYDGEEDAVIGFQSVVLLGENGPVKILGDRNCPYGLLYALDTHNDNCGIISMGPMLDFLKYEDDDNRFLRHASENAMEARLGGYLQFYARTPGLCGVANVAASGLSLVPAEN